MSAGKPQGKTQDSYLIFNSIAVLGLGFEYFIKKKAVKYGKGKPIQHSNTHVSMNSASRGRMYMWASFCLPANALIVMFDYPSVGAVLI